VTIKTAASLLGCTLISYLTLGQTTDANDFVVLVNGDTIKGKIAGTAWNINPESITFTHQGIKSTYTPQTIRQFRTASGAYYVSKIVEIDKTEHRTTAIARASITTVQVETAAVFLEVLLEGHFDLYALRKNGKNHYFLKSHDGHTSELIQRKLWSNELKQVVTQSLYRDVLASYASSCAKLAGKASKLYFNSTSLVKFVKDLNGCSGQPNTYELKIEKISLAVSLGAGASASKIKFVRGPQSTNYNLVGATKGTYPMSIDPFASLKVNVIVPKTQKRWSGFVDFAYKSINTTSTANNDLKVYYFKLSVGPQYTWQSSRLKPFVSLGVFQGFPLYYYIENLEESKNAQGTTVTQGTLLDKKGVGSFRGVEQGYFFTTGLHVAKRVGAEIRLERSNGVSVWPGITSPVVSAYVLFTYQFGRSNRELN
jgi:hypothetical protein